MQVLIVNQVEIARLLPMAECVEVMERALKTLSRGQAMLPLRTIMRLPDGKNAFANDEGALAASGTPVATAVAQIQAKLDARAPDSGVTGVLQAGASLKAGIGGVIE
jgi:hypothetical protein